jgi:hypothetical protein
MRWRQQDEVKRLGLISPLRAAVRTALTIFSTSSCMSRYQIRDFHALGGRQIAADLS